MAALLGDCAHQPVEPRWLAGLLPDLTDVGDHPWLVHPVDARPCGGVVEVAGGNIKPGALHRTSEAEQRHDHPQTELATPTRPPHSPPALPPNHTPPTPPLP